MQPLRVLIVDPDRPTQDLIRRTATSLRAAEVVAVPTMAAAQATLSDPERPFDLVFAETELGDADGPKLAHWIRAGEASQRPNIPIVFMREAPLLTAAPEAVGGGRMLLKKPLTQGRIAAVIDGITDAYANFVVSPTYVGPERRLGKRPFAGERRLTSSNAILIVEDPVKYELKDETIVVVFDYLRLRVSGADSRSFRDFVTRDYIRPAISNLGSMQHRILSQVSEHHAVLEAELAALNEASNGAHLRQMHETSWDVAVITSGAGWVLMTSIAKSLHHYSSGAYRPSGRLVRFLGSHVAALKSALTRRIFDDGGRIGQLIVETVRSAELVFRRASLNP